MVVASHNLMNGHRLDPSHYRDLRDGVGLDVLCLQENRPGPRGWPCIRIASELGPGFRYLGRDPDGGLGIVYNHKTLRCIESERLLLPRLERLTWFERRYIASGRPDPRWVQITRFEPILRAVESERGADPRGAGSTARPIAIANFHLETAGTQDHRQRQTRHIADLLRAREHTRRIVACGDTNAFAMPWKLQIAALDHVLAPLVELGLRDIDTRPTHFFARQDEPLLTHQILCRLGRLGIDLPQRYDVVCTDLPVEDHGQITTPGSDHDLVWARMATS